jgi:sedoheptulokinase
MTILLGIDVGTTTCCALTIDPQNGRVHSAVSLDNSAALPPPVGYPERHELDLNRLYSLVDHLLGQTVQALGDAAGEVCGIAVTGQQHGLALLDAANRPLRPAITWQDGRTSEPEAERNGSSLAAFVARAGGRQEMAVCGCQPRAGYVGPLLFWLQQHDQLPAGARACFIPDAVVSYLTGRPPVCDATNGGGSGVMDLVTGEWHWTAVQRLGLDPSLFPAIRASAEPCGTLDRDVAERTGLTPGLPIGTALGDNQASYLGSVADPQRDLLINVGTGSQLSVATEHFLRLDDAEIETRALPDGRYLLVCAGLFGGRSYAYLRDLFRSVGRTFFAAAGDEELYEAMNAAAAAVPPGSDGVRCQPFFTGLRSQPELRGSFAGLSPETLTPGHLTRALLEGMAEAFAAFSQRMEPHSGPRSQLIGAGNGIRKNPLLAGILAARFGHPLDIPLQEEPAAAGAALLLGVRLGLLPDLAAIGALLRYRRIEQPPWQY